MPDLPQARICVSRCGMWRPSDLTPAQRRIIRSLLPEDGPERIHFETPRGARRASLRKLESAGLLKFSHLKGFGYFARLTHEGRKLGEAIVDEWFNSLPQRDEAWFQSLPERG